MADRIQIERLKEDIDTKEKKLQNMMSDFERIWEDTGLEPEDSSYLIEKTMRFELAQKDINIIFLSFNELLKKYKSLCNELEGKDE